MSAIAVGLRPGSQYIGPDDEQITLSGSLYPEITGGRVSLELLNKLADTGKAYPVIEGTGIMHGMFVIEKISTTRTEFFSDIAEKSEFTVSPKRVDEQDRGLLRIGDRRSGFGQLTDIHAIQSREFCMSVLDSLSSVTDQLSINNPLTDLQGRQAKASMADPG